MNLNRSFLLLGATAALTTVGMSGTTAEAQPEQTETLQGQNAAQVGALPVQGAARKRNQMIKLKNVSAKMMAYWLNPGSNVVPNIFGASPQTPKPIGNEPHPAASAMLPEGVDRIVAIDPQNAILVFGTDEGVKAIQELVGTLDRPLKQVEIEAQIIAINDKDLKAFKVDSTPANGGQGTVGFVRGNFQATLQDLLAAKKVTLISAPRMTAINNLEAVVKTETTQPMSVDLAGKAVKPVQVPSDPALPPETLLNLKSGYEIKTTPTINNDDTVTLDLGLRQILRLDKGNENENESINISRFEAVNAILNIRDGKTVVINLPHVKTGESRETALKGEPKNVIFFVTPRIIRRVGDDTAK